MDRDSFSLPYRSGLAAGHVFPVDMLCKAAEYYLLPLYRHLRRPGRLWRRSPLPLPTGGLSSQFTEAQLAPSAYDLAHHFKQQRERQWWWLHVRRGALLEMINTIKYELPSSSDGCPQIMGSTTSTTLPAQLVQGCSHRQGRL